MSRMGDGKTEMSLQSRARRLNGSRRLAEVSVLPIVPCLRRSVSAPEIPCLRRQTPCPEAMATLAGRKTCKNGGWAAAGFLYRRHHTARSLIGKRKKKCLPRKRRHDGAWEATFFFYVRVLSVFHAAVLLNCTRFIKSDL